MDWGRFSNWDDGVYVGANLRFEKAADGSYFDLRANHIADDSHYVRAVFGRAGKYRVQLFARSQPNITSGNARSIWDGVGSNHLTLKDGLVPAGSTDRKSTRLNSSH